MDITSVVNYLREFMATVMILLTMIFPFGSDNSAKSYEALNSDELVASFVVLSDIHVESNQPKAYGHLKDVLDGVKAGKDVDAVIYTGDNVMNGQTIENILFYNAIKAAKPCDKNFVLAGNHDLGNSAGDYEKLLDNYILNNKLYLGEDVGKGYFYRVVNGCYIICLVSEAPSTWALDMGEEQFTWLEGVLQQAKEADAPIFVFNHFPVNYEGNASARLTALLNEYDADLFVHGHYHDHPIYAGNFYNYKGVKSVNMTRPTEMKLFDAGEGIVIEVYENEFVVRVRNFITGEWNEDLVRTYKF